MLHFCSEVRNTVLPVPNLKMKKIFFLEDEDAVAEVTIQLMESWGVKADFVRSSNLGEAVRMIAEQPRPLHFDAAFLDYQLPDGYGTSLMEVFRRMCPTCKVFVYSSLIDMDPDATRIIRRYAPNFMLTKPYNCSIFQQNLRDAGLL